MQGAIGSDAALVATVRHPGEYQILSFYTPMYLFAALTPKDIPKSVLVGGKLPEYWAWARQNGGVPGQEQSFRLILRGRDEQPVIINALRPRIVERRSPLTGWFSHERGCGDVAVREARIDFDRDPPAIDLRVRGLPEEPARDQLPLTLQVSASDIEVIDVLAVTRRSDIRWELEVLYSAADDTGVLVVRDGDEPFEVTGLQRGLARYYRRDYRGEQLPVRLIRDREGDPSTEGLTQC